MNNIKALRQMRGWSRRELARRIGTSDRQLLRLETGERRLSDKWLTTLASALGCGIADLIPAVEAGPKSDAREVPVPRPLRQRNVALYAVDTDVIAEAGFGIGAQVAVATSPDAIAARVIGDIVVLADEVGNILLRQWIPPALIVTNAPGTKQSASRLDDPALKLKVIGVVMRNGHNP